MIAHVYWIKLNSYTDIKTEGYIGVTERLDKRINEHLNSCHDNIKLKRYINKHKDDVIIELVYEGTLEDCLKKEIELRPFRQIGWNIAEGGGKPPIQWGNEYWKLIKNRHHQKEVVRQMHKDQKEGKIKVFTYGQNGRHWWNNGIITTMAKKCPGPKWSPGRINLKKYQKRKSKEYVSFVV